MTSESYLPLGHWSERPGRLLNVLFTFSFGPVSKGVDVMPCQAVVPPTLTLSYKTDKSHKERISKDFLWESRFLHWGNLHWDIHRACYEIGTQTRASKCKGPKYCKMLKMLQKQFPRSINDPFCCLK